MSVNNALNTGTIPLPGSFGGTGVNNSTSQITIGGNVTFSGPHTFTGTITADTAVTFPTSGTLATTAATFVWNDASGTTQAAAVNNGYVCTNAAQTTVTLPATAALGSVVSVQGKGAGSWILAPNAGQNIQVGQTNATTSVTAAAQYDSISVVCIVANTTWAVTSVLSSGVTTAP